jgi:hypothetical protein
MNNKNSKEQIEEIIKTKNAYAGTFYLEKRDFALH